MIKNFKSGIAEVLKYAFIKDYKLYKLLTGYDLSTIKEEIEVVIKRCIEIKSDVVSRDEIESGERMLLNFGHTLGHAIERYFDYKKYTHGQAVGHGMYMMVQGLFKMNKISETTYNDAIKLLKSYDMLINENLDKNQLMAYTYNDKKSLGQEINAVFIKSIGESYIEKISFDKLMEIVEATC